MKACPNCGEMNGESNDKCYKCGADLLEATNRYCRNCDEVYSSKVNTCPTCGESTVVYNPFTMSKQTHHNNNYIETWIYVIAVLFPIIGFILGCIQIGKNNSTKEEVKAKRSKNYFFRHNSRCFAAACNKSSVAPTKNSDATGVVRLYCTAGAETEQISGETTASGNT